MLFLYCNLIKQLIKPKHIYVDDVNIELSVI